MGELEKLRAENEKLKLLLVTAMKLLAKSKALLAQRNRSTMNKKKAIAPKKRARS